MVKAQSSSHLLNLIRREKIVAEVAANHSRLDKKRIFRSSFFISVGQGDLDPWYHGLKPSRSESLKPLGNIGIITETFLPRLLKKLPEAFFFPNSYHQ